MQSFLQFLIIGLGAGATYALFAQGAVLIYRGSGLVNFAQGAIGTFAAYIAFVDLKDKQGWATLPAVVVAVVAAGAGVARCSRRSSSARCGARRAIVRVIATIGLLGLLQAVVAKRYGVANQPVDSYLPHDVWHVGRHHRPGGADLPRRHHARRDRSGSGPGRGTPASGWPSAPAPRTNGRCRRSAGRPTASPRSPGRSAGCSAGSPPCSPRRSPACRPSRSRSW